MSFWFARQANGIRGWVIVLDGTGTLRTGLTTGNFTATIVSSADDAVTTATVTESLQKAGLYRFDVPSAFLVTNGVGEYGVVVEVSAINPPLTDAFGTVLKVAQEDFDSLASAAAIDESHLNATHNDSLNELELQAWLVRDGVTVTSPTAVALTWRNPDGTVLFTLTETDAAVGQDPDPQGVFYFTRTQALADDATYAVEVSITDALGTVTTTRGVGTI